MTFWHHYAQMKWLLIWCVRGVALFRDVSLMTASIFFKLSGCGALPSSRATEVSFVCCNAGVFSSFLPALSPQTILSLPLPDFLLGMTQGCSQHLSPTSPQCCLFCLFLGQASCESAK